MKECGKFVFYGELSAMLPRLLRDDPKLRGLPHRCAQMAAQNFDRTLKHYIRHKAEFLLASGSKNRTVSSPRRCSAPPRRSDCPA